MSGIGLLFKLKLLAKRLKPAYSICLLLTEGFAAECSSFMSTATC
jgi:hypothetical protein